MKKKNDADMLAVIARASNCHAMRPALVLDDRTYTYQELFGLAGSICETLRNLKEDIIGITAENCIETYASILAVMFSGKTYVLNIFCPLSCKTILHDIFCIFYYMRVMKNYTVMLIASGTWP